MQWSRQLFQRFNQSQVAKLHWITITKQLECFRREGRPYDAIFLGRQAFAEKNEPPKQVYEELIWSLGDMAKYNYNYIYDYDHLTTTNDTSDTTENSSVSNDSTHSDPDANRTGANHSLQNSIELNRHENLASAPQTTDALDEDDSYSTFSPDDSPEHVSAHLALSLLQQMVGNNIGISSGVYAIVSKLVSASADPFMCYTLAQIWMDSVAPRATRSANADTTSSEATQTDGLVDAPPNFRHLSDHPNSNYATATDVQARPADDRPPEPIFRGGLIAANPITSMSAIMGSLEKRPFLSQLLLCHLACTSLEQVFALLQQMVMANSGAVLPIPYHVYEKLLFCCCIYDDMDFAFELMQHLNIHHHGRINTRTWGIFLQCAARCADYNAIKWAWHRAVVPGCITLDGHTLWQVCQIACRHGNSAMAKSAYSRMLRRHTSVDRTGNAAISTSNLSSSATSVTFYESLINCYAIEQNIPQALDLLSRIPESIASQLRLRNVPRLVNAVSRLSTKGNFARLVDYLKTMCENNVGSALAVQKTFLLNVICASLVSAHKDETSSSSVSTGDDANSGSRIDPALKLLRWFLQPHLAIQPNQDTILCFLHLAYLTSDILLCQEMLSLAVAHKVPLSRSIYDLALQIAVNTKSDRAVQALKQAMEKHGFKSRLTTVHLHM